MARRVRKTTPIFVRLILLFVPDARWPDLVLMVRSLLAHLYSHRSPFQASSGLHLSVFSRILVTLYWEAVKAAGGAGLQLFITPLDPPPLSKHASRHRTQ